MAPAPAAAPSPGRRFEGSCEMPGRFAIPDPAPGRFAIPAPEPMPVLGRVLGNVDGRFPIDPPPAPMFGRLPPLGSVEGRLPAPMLPPPTLGRDPAPVLGRVLGTDGRLGVEGRAAGVDGRVAGLDGAEGRAAGRLNDGELPIDGREPPLGRLNPPPPPPPRKPPPPPPRPPRPKAKSVEPITTATRAATAVIQSRVFMNLPPDAICVARSKGCSLSPS